jgi:putative heme-binding domain-containing protein
MATQKSYRLNVVMFPFVLFIVVACVQSLAAEDHQHHHGSSETVIKRPRVFLDKSKRIVDYQLRRLDNARLLLVETATDDPKYVPVFKAILLRAGMPRRNRDDAAAALAVLHGTDISAELFAALGSLNDNDGDERRVGREISAMLLSQPAAVLAARVEEFRNAVVSDNSLLRATAHAGLIMTGHADDAWQQAQVDAESRLAWLAAVTLVPAGPVRDELRNVVVSLLESTQPRTVRTRAIEILPMIAADSGETFRRIASFVPFEEFRTVAVRSLLKIPVDVRDSETSKRLVDVLVRHAEQLPAAQRTTDASLDALQLADELLSKLSAADSASYRDRLREISVRVVRLGTVKEEMCYDRSFFAVEAGRPVQVILENNDLMPHNLVITAPGQLRKVALEGAELGATPGLDGKMYVPKSPDVLYSTKMVNAGTRESLTLTAPTEPGEYPYVCTFPRHWMRMYGVMVVVADLDEWQRHPIPPEDPLGNNRSTVQIWTMADFPRDELTKALRARSPSIGARLFKEATCLGCHKMDREGGAVGPELTDVLQRLKTDHHGILREILEPSYRVDPKYVVKVVIDVKGKTTSGIVVAEDKTSISIVVNPEIPQPTVILKKDIDEVIPTTTSMMPKGLLDKFTDDEVMEILSYITSSEK